MGENLENPGLNRGGQPPEPGAEVLSPSGWHARFTRQAGWTAGLRKFLYDRLNLQEAGRVLEVGCGTGALLGELLAQFRAQVHGIDFNPEYLALAQHDQQAASYSRLSLTLADAHDLPFAPACFDIGLCHFLLLWVVDPGRVLSEMRRATRPGGAVLALAEPDYGGRIDYPPELARLGEWQRGALRRQGADPSLGRKLGSLFNAVGLEEVEVGVLGGQWSGSPAPEEFESEWAVLRSDLAEMHSSVELDHLQALDARAWQQRERVLFVPTFYAWGRVPV